MGVGHLLLEKWAKKCLHDLDNSLNFTRTGLLIYPIAK